MLKQRVLTALIALPFALAILVYAPREILLLFFTALVAVGTYEATHMVLPRFEQLLAPSSPEPSQWPVWVAVVFAGLIFVFSALDPQSAGRGAILFGGLGSILLGCFFSNNNDLALARVATLLLGLAYGAFPWLATWELYLLAQDSRYLLLLIAVVWGGDTGAYFGGKYLGKRKLAPRMSPNKTLEGALCGLVASVGLGLLINFIYLGELGPLPTIALASALGGAFGQMGDLVESTFKRFAHVKDSGKIFPGHGGFLDRVDGVLFAAPMIWFILYLSGI